MRKSILAIFLLSFLCLSAQNTGSTSAKMDYIYYPTLPVEGLNTLGLEVYTADLPFNQDTLRYYLGNMDLMKSGGERLSKIKHTTLGEVQVQGMGGDVTVSLAFGEPKIVSKELKDAQCMIPKDGCKQYYFSVSYELPAVVRASNASGVLETWELDAAMQLAFGNEQVETQNNMDGTSTTTIRTVSFASPEVLEKAFERQNLNWLSRKAVIIQLSRLAESIYPRLYFLQDDLKFDIAYGKGNATDYSETETTAQAAVEALEAGDYKALLGPIGVWEKWLDLYDASDKKAAVNHKVAEGLHNNLAIAYAFTGDYEKARIHLDETMVFAQQGMVNVNEVDRLKRFHGFIDDREVAMANNGKIAVTNMVEAPDLKALLGRRKFNEELDFLRAEDKYQEFAKAIEKTSTEPMTLEGALGAMLAEGSGTSYENRVQNGVLILNVFFDKDLNGNPMPESICELQGLSTLNARNLGMISVPQCLSKLNGLTKLILDGNALTALPADIGDLTELTNLNISDNQLTELPESFYNLKSLKKLTISGNNLNPDVMKTLEERLPDCKIK